MRAPWVRRHTICDKLRIVGPAPDIGVTERGAPEHALGEGRIGAPLGAREALRFAGPEVMSGLKELEGKR
jgi:hypothetical protein